MFLKPKNNDNTRRKGGGGRARERGEVWREGRQGGGGKEVMEERDGGSGWCTIW